MLWRNKDVCVTHPCKL